MAGMRDAAATKASTAAGSDGAEAPEADPIAAALRALYRDTETEPLPPQLTELLARLAAEERR